MSGETSSVWDRSVSNDELALLRRRHALESQPRSFGTMSCLPRTWTGVNDNGPGGGFAVRQVVADVTKRVTLFGISIDEEFSSPFPMDNNPEGRITFSFIAAEKLIPRTYLLLEAVFCYRIAVPRHSPAILSAFPEHSLAIL